MGLCLLAGSSVTLGVAFHLVRGDLKCTVPSRDSEWGEATWSWPLLGTTCSFAEVVPERGPESPAPVRVAVLLVAVAGTVTALRSLDRAGAWRLGLPAGVGGLGMIAAVVAASGFYLT